MICTLSLLLLSLSWFLLLSYIYICIYVYLSISLAEERLQEVDETWNRAFRGDSIPGSIQHHCDVTSRWGHQLVQMSRPHPSLQNRTTWEQTVVFVKVWCLLPSTGRLGHILDGIPMDPPPKKVSGCMDPDWNDSNGLILPSPLWVGSIRQLHHQSIWRKQRKQKKKKHNLSMYIYLYSFVLPWRWPYLSPFIWMILNASEVSILSWRWR